MKYAFVGGEIVNASGNIKGTVIVENGRVASIEKELNDSLPHRVFDARNYYILPGIIDLNAEMDHSVHGFPAAFSREEIEMTRINNGVTSVSLPYIEKEDDNQATVNFTYRYEMALKDLNPSKAEQLITKGIHHWVVYCRENDNIWNREWERIQTAITGRSILLWFKFVPDETIRKNSKTLQRKLMLKPPFTNALYEGVNQKKFIDELIALTQTAKMHIGVSETVQPEALSRIINARNEQSSIYINLAVPYLLYSADHYAGDNGQNYICNPPLLYEKERETLIKLLFSGAYTTLSSYTTMLSDKARSRVMKNLPDRIGVNKEDSFSLLLKLNVTDDRFNLNRFVRMASQNPARLIGCYPQKGTIQPGADADFILVNRETMTIDYVFIRGLCVKQQDTVVLQPGIGGLLNLCQLKRFIC